MGILQIFDMIFIPIQEYIKMLKDSAISDYLFGGNITLYSFIIIFIAIFLIARAFLKPVALRAGRDSPVEPEPEPTYGGKTQAQIYSKMMRDPSHPY